MKAPDRPLTPPVSPMLFLPFSFTFRVMSTVPSCAFCLISESCSGFSDVEVLQLVQAQQAQFPQVAVVNLALFQRQFAADDLVARGGVALELDAANVELLAFVQIDAQADEFLFVVGIGVGHRREVDVAQSGVGLAQSFQAFTDGLGIEDVAIFDLEQATQRLGVLYRLVAGEGDLLQPVALAFFHRAW